MSTLKVINIQHPHAANPAITLASDGSFSGGGGLSGTSYVFVGGDGTATENGTELQEAYIKAKALTPYGSALSNTNRATVIVGPGTYDTTLAMDGEFVNVMSLDGETSVLLTGIDVTADNVLVRGIDVGSAPFTIAKDLGGLVAEKCVGGPRSFVFNGDCSGTFIDCTGDYESFGTFAIASGTFINCTGGDSSFAQGGAASGTFINCTGGVFAFGSLSIASGTFTNCTGGINAFGSFSIASGTFTNCTGGVNAFGGPSSIASGTFTNCTGGVNAFGSNNGTLSGNVLWCRLTSGGFQTPSGAGKIRMSLTGTFVETNQG